MASPIVRRPFKRNRKETTLMTRRLLPIAAPLASLALLSAAASAQDEAPAEETAEQKAARELCTEEAAPGAYAGWSISQGETCQNSFANVCTVVRNADGVEASYTCYVPPPMPEDEAEPEPGEG